MKGKRVRRVVCTHEKEANHGLFSKKRSTSKRLISRSPVWFCDRRQVFWLVSTSTAFPYVSTVAMGRNPVFTNLKLTAAGTAPEFHRVPFSSCSKVQEPAIGDKDRDSCLRSVFRSYFNPSGSCSAARLACATWR